MMSERLVWTDDAKRAFRNWAPGLQAEKNQAVYWAPEGWHSAPMDAEKLPYVCEWGE
jgi:hypothetical protein